MSIHEAETATSPEIEVVIDGKPYRLVVGNSNCGSLKHRHPELHADGTDGQEPHHHHDASCGDIPRQGTLYPVWEITPRHQHAFDDEETGECPCGAYRELCNDIAPKRGREMYWYQIPADPSHPKGWSYERWEPIDRETAEQVMTERAQARYGEALNELKASEV